MIHLDDTRSLLTSSFMPFGHSSRVMEAKHGVTNTNTNTLLMFIIVYNFLFCILRLYLSF